MSTVVQTKDELLQKLMANSEQIFAFGIKSIGLFGSFVRNKDITNKSDIDLLIEFLPDQASLKNLVYLGDFLEKLTGRKVDLVTNNSLSKFIGPHILKEVQHVPLARPGIITPHRRSA